MMPVDTTVLGNVLESLFSGVNLKNMPKDYKDRLDFLKNKGLSTVSMNGWSENPPSLDGVPSHLKITGSGIKVKEKDLLGWIYDFVADVITKMEATKQKFNTKTSAQTFLKNNFGPDKMFVPAGYNFNLVDSNSPSPGFVKSSDWESLLDTILSYSGGNRSSNGPNIGGDDGNGPNRDPVAAEEFERLGDELNLYPTERFVNFLRRARANIGSPDFYNSTDKLTEMLDAIRDRGFKKIYGKVEKFKDITRWDEQEKARDNFIYGKGHTGKTKTDPTEAMKILEEIRDNDQVYGEFKARAGDYTKALEDGKRAGNYMDGESSNHIRLLNKKSLIGRGVDKVKEQVRDTIGAKFSRARWSKLTPGVRNLVDGLEIAGINFNKGTNLSEILEKEPVLDGSAKDTWKRIKENLKDFKGQTHFEEALRIGEQGNKLAADIIKDATERYFNQPVTPPHFRVKIKQGVMETFELLNAARWGFTTSHAREGFNEKPIQLITDESNEFMKWFGKSVNFVFNKGLALGFEVGNIIKNQIRNSQSTRMFSADGSRTKLALWFAETKMGKAMDWTHEKDKRDALMKEIESQKTRDRGAKSWTEAEKKYADVPETLEIFEKNFTKADKHYLKMEDILATVEQMREQTENDLELANKRLVEAGKKTREVEEEMNRAQDATKFFLDRASVENDLRKAKLDAANGFAKAASALKEVKEKISAKDAALAELAEAARELEQLEQIDPVPPEIGQKRSAAIAKVERKKAELVIAKEELESAESIHVEALDDLEAVKKLQYELEDRLDNMPTAEENVRAKYINAEKKVKALGDAHGEAGEACDRLGEQLRLLDNELAWWTEGRDKAKAKREEAKSLRDMVKDIHKADTDAYESQKEDWERIKNEGDRTEFALELKSYWDFLASGGNSAFWTGLGNHSKKETEHRNKNKAAMFHTASDGISGKLVGEEYDPALHDKYMVGQAEKSLDKQMAEKDIKPKTFEEYEKLMKKEMDKLKLSEHDIDLQNAYDQFRGRAAGF